MPSYAVFGSTGNVGQAILKVLLQDSDNEIHAYCRTKEKLYHLLPETRNNSQVKIFEGALSNQELLVDCLRGTRACFLALAPKGNQPGTTVVSDSARQIVAALEDIKANNARESLPKIVLLSSASTEHRLMSTSPKLFLNILYRAFSNTYDDLKRAERFLRSREDVTSTTFVKPGALSDDEQRGHLLDGQQAKTPVSMLDLAAGMLEIGNDTDGRYDQKSMAVNSKSDQVKFPWAAPLKLLLGLTVHFFPWTYRLLY